MLTTKQVRAIIRKHTTNTYGLYTNKTTGYVGPNRRVKCYFHGNVELYTALQKAAGRANVYLTPGSDYCHSPGPAIIVKCVIG
jgi:hypothetical protein